MSQPNTFNPYPLQVIIAGLTSIVYAIPPNPQVAQLVGAVESYIISLYYPGATAQVKQEIQSIAYNVINSLRNNLVLSGNTTFNRKQAPFIQILIGPSMTANLAPDSFIDRIADIEDNIGTSGLNVNEQQPLFLATYAGSDANKYWVTQLSLGTSSLWHPHFSSNDGENYMNTLEWSVAAMIGSLAGYGATPEGLIEPTINRVTTQMVSSFIGALTATAGKLIYNWIPRIVKPLEPPIMNVAVLNNCHY